MGLARSFTVPTCIVYPQGGDEVGEASQANLNTQGLWNTLWETLSDASNRFCWNREADSGLQERPGSCQE